MADPTAAAAPGRLARLGAWIDERFPMTSLWKEHVSEYYAPKNFNFWYYFGSIALFVLALQIVTGIFLTMSYKPSATEAFGSVEYIMRDVEWGWLIRYLHSTGASAFFIVVYLHMFRALLYGSHRKPRELLWIFGVLIYLALMAEAFFGYLLPWGNMSYWGAQVIVSLFGTFPLIGDFLIEWIRGDYFISDITLNRFFRAARGGAAAGADLPGRRAHPRAARGRLEQPGRHRDQEDEGSGTAIRSTGYRFIPTTRSRTSSASASSWCCSRPWSSSRRRWAGCSSRRRTSSRPIRC